MYLVDFQQFSHFSNSNQPDQGMIESKQSLKNRQNHGKKNPNLGKTCKFATIIAFALNFY